MKEQENKNSAKDKLSNHEIRFCELFVYGGAEYQWKADECYKAAVLNIFDDEEDLEYQRSPELLWDVAIKSNRMKNKPEIKEYIRELLSENADADTERAVIRAMSIDTLTHIAVEGAHHTYQDEHGNKIVPASLRQASIKAIDTLTKIMPSIKDEEDASVGGQATITFTVTPQGGVNIKGEDDE